MRDFLKRLVALPAWLWDGLIAPIRADYRRQEERIEKGLCARCECVITNDNRNGWNHTICLDCQGFW